jgi:ADP-heptose:LPS heptosyltransferase
LNGAEQIFHGMDNVELFVEDKIPERIYLLGLQTMWPYKGLEKYVAQIRYAPTPLNLWNIGIKAHEVEANMSLAYSLKYKGDIPSLYCASSPCKIEWPNMNAKQNIGIHVCRRYNHQFHANRQLWDTAGIGKALLELGHRVFIIGHEDAVDKDQRDKSPEFIYALGMPLPEVASLIKEIDLMINEDSGIMHVTAAMDTPQIALFGPTSNIKNAPWSDRAFVARKGDLACAPCQYTERGQNCYKAECMDIDLEYILSIVDEMINNGI